MWQGKAHKRRGGVEDYRLVHPRVRFLTISGNDDLATLHYSGHVWLPATSTTSILFDISRKRRGNWFNGIFATALRPVRAVVFADLALAGKFKETTAS
jgi:hypothetical protein